MMENKVDKILIVDDNEMDTLVAQAIIRGMNITNEITIVYDGKQAIDHLRENSNFHLRGKFQILVLLDINMPVMNGFEFLEEFNKLESLENIKVVILSSSDDKMDIANANRLDVSDYLVKPLSKEKLKIIINKM